MGTQLPLPIHPGAAGESLHWSSPWFSHSQSLSIVDFPRDILPPSPLLRPDLQEESLMGVVLCLSGETLATAALTADMTAVFQGCDEPTKG